MVLFKFSEPDASGKCYREIMVLGSTCHRRFQEWVKLDVLKRMWIGLLKEYDNKKGIKWN
jgi:hypothetical protein